MNNWLTVNRKLVIGAAIVFYIISVIVNLGYPELDGEEPRRALISIEMLESGHYIAPTMLGWEYYNKPPVYNWVLCFFMYITNSTAEWAVRLPSLVFILLWSFIHYAITKRFLQKTIAGLSAVFLLTNGEIFFYGLQNGGEIDFFYGFIVYLQVILVFYFYEKRKWLPLFAWSYLFCAIGFLTKGFPSIVFQAFTLLALIFYARSFKAVFKWQHAAGLFVFAAIVGGYLYVYSFYSSSPRLLINLLNESLRKTSLGEDAGNVWDKTIGYPITFLTGLLPWSLLLLLLFKRKVRYSLWHHPLLRFSLLFLIFNIWVYWFTGTLKLRYSYVFFPFTCTLLAFIYYKFSNQYKTWTEKGLTYLVFPFWILLGAVIVLPFLYNVPLLPVILIPVALIVFSIIYIKIKDEHIWLFAMGFIIIRFTYALLFLPVIDDNRKSIKYKPYMNELARINANGPLFFYASPDTFSVKADAKFWKWELEKILAPPEIYKQIPYYYYRATGSIVKYDTAMVPGNSYFTYPPLPRNKNINTLWSFYDQRMKSDFVFFRAGGN